MPKGELVKGGDKLSLGTVGKADITPLSKFQALLALSIQGNDIKLARDAFAAVNKLEGEIQMQGLVLSEVNILKILGEINEKHIIEIREEIDEKEFSTDESKLQKALRYSFKQFRDLYKQKNYKTLVDNMEEDVPEIYADSIRKYVELIPLEELNESLGLFDGLEVNKDLEDVILRKVMLAISEEFIKDTLIGFITLAGYDNSNPIEPYSDPEFTYPKNITEIVEGFLVNSKYKDPEIREKSRMYLSNFSTLYCLVSNIASRLVDSCENPLSTEEVVSEELYDFFVPYVFSTELLDAKKISKKIEAEIKSQYTEAGVYGDVNRN